MRLPRPVPGLAPAALAFVTLLASALPACGKSSQPDACTGGPTWTSTVAIIVKRACAPCHSSVSANRYGALPGHDFDTYQEVTGKDPVTGKDAGHFVDAITNLSQPPMDNPLGLQTSRQEQAVIKSWEACGFPE